MALANGNVPPEANGDDPAWLRRFENRMLGQFGRMDARNSSRFDGLDARLDMLQRRAAFE